jgi:hypothetical protein
MHDHDKAIAAWRERLAAAGTCFDADLDELESHLRDDLDALAEVGITGAEAFHVAEQRLGDSSALAAEFAKVNPTLAWRVPMFWLSVGFFFVMLAVPLYVLGPIAALSAGLALHARPATIVAVVWALGLVPLACVPAFLWMGARHLRAPFRWADRPWCRIALIAAAAAAMLGERVLGAWAWHLDFWGWAPRAELHAVWQPAWHAADRAATISAVGLALGVGAFALLLRAAAKRGRAVEAPMLWLVAGTFVGIVRAELSYFMRAVVLVGGGLAQLGSTGVALLMWATSMALPALLLASAYLWVRRGASPRETLRSRLMIVAIPAAAAVASGVSLWLADAANRSAYELLARSVWSDGQNAWLAAQIPVACILPVVVGAVMFRLRPTAVSATRGISQ